jgi:hypothetical protein
VSRLLSEGPPFASNVPAPGLGSAFSQGRWARGASPLQGARTSRGSPTHASFVAGAQAIRFEFGRWPQSLPRCGQGHSAFAWRHTRMAGRGEARPTGRQTLGGFRTHPGRLDFFAGLRVSEDPSLGACPLQRAWRFPTRTAQQWRFRPVTRQVKRKGFQWLRGPTTNGLASGLCGWWELARGLRPTSWVACK